VYAYAPNFASVGLFYRRLAAKIPIFALFWTSAFCAVATWHQSEKVEHGCTTTNFPYPKASKSSVYSNAFMATSGAQHLTFKSVTNKHQIDTQKTSTFLAAPAGVKF